MTDDNWQIIENKRTTNFTGYDELESTVHPIRYIEEGDFIYIVLDKTPFYAEAGGQIGDKGEIISGEFNFKVKDQENNIVQIENGKFSKLQLDTKT